MDDMDTSDVFWVEKSGGTGRKSNRDSHYLHSDV